MQEQARIFLSDYFVDLQQSLLCLLDALPQRLVLEFYYFFQLLVTLLVQLQVQDLNVLELGTIAQRQPTLTVRVNQQLCAQLLPGLLNSIQRFYYNRWQFLQVYIQSLLLLDQAKGILVAPNSKIKYSNLATKKGSF